MLHTSLPNSVGWKLKFENQSLEKEFIKDYDLKQRPFYILGIYLTVVCWMPAFVAVYILQPKLFSWALISILPYYFYLIILLFIFKKNSILGKYQYILFIVPIIATILAIFLFQFLLDIERPYSSLLAAITIQVFAIFLFRLRFIFSVLLILVSSGSHLTSLLFVPVTQGMIIYNIGTCFDFFVVMIPAAYYFDRYSRTIFLQEKLLLRENQRVLSLNTDIKYINEEVKTVNETLKLTLNTVQHQKDQILASINYAKRIQNAILPTEQRFDKLLSNNFVLYKPRDIVSGDFYYIREIDNKIILAAVDCTGHGVPGAFMSFIGYLGLNALTVIEKIISASEILKQMHIGIRHILRQKETNNNDGMDMAFVSIDLENKKLTFAGAKNPLIYIQNGELHQIKGDIFGIGGEQREMERNYTLHEIDITEPTTFYLFSDGYQDQFGGANKNKFMSKHFRNLLFEIHSKPMQEQKEILEKTLQDWMQAGNQHQTDDILVIGVRV
jgi:serine phosphatase RsbU (regulator of sigma subunit)